MTPLKDNPLFLLLTTGALLGLYFPIGRLAGQLGANPILWALIISLLPGIILALFNLRSTEPWSRGWDFAAVAGLFAYVISNGITFAAIPHIGSGVMALMFACSPIVTALISIALGVRPPSRKLLIGVGLGFLGAVLIALSRMEDGLNRETIWLFIAFLVPLSLGCGNVYRTARWPVGMSPFRMAAQTNLAAAVPLAALLFVFNGLAPLREAMAYPWLMLLQVIVSAAMFTVFFRLQWVGGPTYLSQIGYVAAAVGLGAAVLFLGEEYPPLIWVGAGFIASGVVVSNWR